MLKKNVLWVTGFPLQMVEPAINGMVHHLLSNFYPHLPIYHLLLLSIPINHQPLCLRARHTVPLTCSSHILSCYSLPLSLSLSLSHVILLLIGFLSVSLSVSLYLNREMKTSPFTHKPGHTII